MKGPGRDLHMPYVIIGPDETAGHGRGGARVAGRSRARRQPIPIPFSYLDLRLQSDAIEGTLIAPRSSTSRTI